MRILKRICRILGLDSTVTVKGNLSAFRDQADEGATEPFLLLMWKDNKKIPPFGLSYDRFDGCKIKISDQDGNVVFHGTFETYHCRELVDRRGLWLRFYLKDVPPKEWQEWVENRYVAELTTPDDLLRRYLPHDTNP